MQKIPFPVRQLVPIIAIVLLAASAAHAQNTPPSHWGAVVGFAPKFEPMKAVEPLTGLIFQEDAVGMLRGSEFRIGIGRGRPESGDWGVSFIRKFIDDAEPTEVEEGLGCEGRGGGQNQPFFLDCVANMILRRPDGLQISGLEVHKYFSFVTIKQRVQVGLNIAGGFGVGQGGFATERFDRAFTCTFAPGPFPEPSDDPCAGGTRSQETTTPTGTGVEPFAVIQGYDGKYLPLGKIEIAGTVILTPQVKVRIGGGFNFPGKTTVGLTGIYFFGRN
jgi:hypothetical protein